MKKKLIAIVTSLAMVATMVPATAFAAATAAPQETIATAAAAPTTKAEAEAALAATTKTAETITYADYTDYKTLYDAIEGWSDATEKGQIKNHAKYAAFKAAYDKVAVYAGNLADAVAAIDTANALIAASSDKIDDGETGTVDTAKTAYDTIGKDATCKLGTGQTVESVLNAATTADPDRYSTFQKVLEISDAVKKIAAVSSVSTKDDITSSTIAGNVSKAINAYSDLTDELKGKVGNASSITTLQTAYTAYTADTESAFLAAMEAYGTGTAAPAYSTTSDTNINALCTAYLTLAAADTDGTVRGKNTVAPEVNRLKGLVRSQWNERDTVLTAAINAVSGKITPAKTDTASITAINDLRKLSDQFYGSAADEDYSTGVVDNSDLYLVLDDSVLGLSSVKSNANTLRLKIKPAEDAAAAAEATILAIAALPTITAANYRTQKSNVTAARENVTYGYDKIAPTAQAKVGNLGKLTNAEAEIKKLEKQVTDAAAALTALDTAEPTASTINSIKAKYEAAKSAYDGLKGEQLTDSAITALNAKITALPTVKTNIEAYEEKAEAIAEAEKLISEAPKGTNAAEALQIAQALAAVNAAETDLSVDPTTIEGIGALNDAVKKVISVIYPNGTADAAAVAAATKPVQDLIDPLKTLNIQTAADVRQVKAARAAYDALINDLEGGQPGNKTAMKEALKEQLNTLVDAEEAANKIDSVNTSAITAFINAVKAIDAGNDLEAITKDNSVDSAYIGKTSNARGRYNALTEEQKEMVAADEVDNAKLAYEKLLIAEANVNSAAALPEVAKLIKAVPNATTLDVNDAAAVAKVKAAQTAYEALSDNVKAQLVSGEYITPGERDNYLDAVAKVANAENEAAAKVAIDAIKALIQLPEVFENQEQITPAQTALTAAEKAYNALTDDQKALVTNASDLATYRTNYNALLKRYVDPLYADAAKIDVEAELSAEDIAKIAELKTYVEGKYIDTATIKDFDQKVYDKLIEALDKVQKDENALENAAIAAIEAVTYDGTAKEPAVTVTDKAGKTLTEEDYTATYVNNVNAGTATVVVTAKSGSVYTGVKTAEFEITPADIKAAAAASKIADKTYTKKAITPAVTVKAGDKTLANGTDYTVSYAKNTNIGQAAVTIKGTGNYKGTITTSFIIKPAKGKVTKLTAGKKQITVSYETQKAQSGKTGYRIICKAKGIKATGINTTAAGKTTVKKLKSGKTYQVKVRAYKTIGGTKYYGSYSTVKKVKVK